MNEKIQDIGAVPAFYSTQVMKARRFNLDVQGAKQQDLAVVCGGCEHCEPDFQIDRADFPFYSIEYVARGQGTLRLGPHTYPLFAGAVFAYGPKVPHFISTHPEDRLVKYFVDFSGSQAESLLREYSPAPGQMVHVGSPNRIQLIFDDLIMNGQNASRYSHLICATILTHLMLKIAETVVVPESTKSLAFATYQSCCEFMRENYLNVKSLAQISEACHVDEAYLCRLFQRFDDQSPYQFLMRLKMNAAALQLQDPKTLIKEIAYDLGFSSAFHFSRTFKRTYGVSPNTFRRLR
jgi:AraC-like DNA-binding protein